MEANRIPERQSKPEPELNTEAQTRMTAGQNPEAKANDNVAASSATENTDSSLHTKLLADSGLQSPTVQLASMDLPTSLFQENQGKTINQIMGDANRNFTWKADTQVAPGFNPASALPNLLRTICHRHNRYVQDVLAKECLCAHRDK